MLLLLSIHLHCAFVFVVLKGFDVRGLAELAALAVVLLLLGGNGCGRFLSSDLAIVEGGILLDAFLNLEE